LIAGLSSVFMWLEVQLLLAGLLEVLCNSFLLLLRLQHLLVFLPGSGDVILAITSLLQEAAAFEEWLHLAVEVILVALGLSQLIELSLHVIELPQLGLDVH